MLLGNVILDPYFRSGASFAKRAFDFLEILGMSATFGLEVFDGAGGLLHAFVGSTRPLCNWCVESGIIGVDIGLLYDGASLEEEIISAAVSGSHLVDVCWIERRFVIEYSGKVVLKMVI